jgi:hypothetical protein
MPAASAKTRCSEMFEYTRSRMSFHPRAGISEGELACRPRSSSSTVSAAASLVVRSRALPRKGFFRSDSRGLRSSGASTAVRVAAINRATPETTVHLSSRAGRSVPRSGLWRLLRSWLP